MSVGSCGAGAEYDPGLQHSKVLPAQSVRHGLTIYLAHGMAEIHIEHVSVCRL